MPPRKKKRPPLVEILWTDITGYGPNWSSAEDVAAAKSTRCRTAGYLVAKTRKEVKVTDSLTEDGGYGGITVIPRGVVHEIRLLAALG